MTYIRVGAMYLIEVPLQMASPIYMLSTGWSTGSGCFNFKES